MMRALIKTLLRSTGTLAVARQVRDEGWRPTVQALRYDWLGAPDGFPLPPPHLRGWVMGYHTSSVAKYLEVGQFCATALRDVLRSAGVGLDAVSPVFDFGCGCGRVGRALWSLEPRLAIAGSDLNAEQVAWCRAHLPYTSVTVNAFDPPLAAPAASFGLLYAFSVFTHIPAAGQVPWLRELARLARPGGLVAISLSGAPYITAHGTPEEQACFQAGELIVRPRPHLGSPDAYNVYHPVPVVQAQAAAAGLRILAHEPGRVLAPNAITQDLWLLRRER